jgi:hypothetical protein
MSGLFKSWPAQRQPIRGPSSGPQQNLSVNTPASTTTTFRGLPALSTPTKSSPRGIGDSPQQKYMTPKDVSKEKSPSNVTPKRIIRKVSNLFNSIPKPTLTNPLKKRGETTDTMYIRKNGHGRGRSRAFSSSTYTSRSSSVDDIRRPSGLGPAAPSSTTSLPLPATSSSHSEVDLAGSGERARAQRDRTEKDKEKKNELLSASAQNNAGQNGTQSPDLYARSRSASSPDLLRKISLKRRRSMAKLKVALRLSSADPQSQSDSEHEIPPPLPMPIPVPVPAPVFPPLPELPIEVLVQILGLFPRHAIPSMALVSRRFLTAAQTVLYTNLDLRGVPPTRYDAIVVFLAARRDLTSLTIAFICPSWPSSFSLTSHPFLTNTASETSRVCSHL